MEEKIMELLRLHNQVFLEKQNGRNVERKMAKLLESLANAPPEVLKQFLERVKKGN